MFDMDLLLSALEKDPNEERLKQLQQQFYDERDRDKAQAILDQALPLIIESSWWNWEKQPQLQRAIDAIKDRAAEEP